MNDQEAAKMKQRLDRGKAPLKKGRSAEKNRSGVAGGGKIGVSGDEESDEKKFENGGWHHKKKEAKEMVEWIIELIKRSPENTSIEDLCKETGKRYRGVGGKLLYVIVLAAKEGMKNGIEKHTETIVKEIKENCYVVKPVYVFLEDSGEELRRDLDEMERAESRL